MGSIEKIKGKKSLEFAYTLENIGVAYYNQGKHNEAIKYSNLSLNILEIVKGKESLDCVSSLNNIGAVYADQGKLN